MTEFYKKESEVEWEPHFMEEKGKIKWVYCPEKDDSPITVLIVSFEEGVTLPEHVHNDQPDLIYVLEGKATMFIDGEGEFDMEPGMIIQVPPNTRHAIRKVGKGGLKVYNVFSPPMSYKKRQN